MEETDCTKSKAEAIAEAEGSKPEPVEEAQPKRDAIDPKGAVDSHLTSLVCYAHDDYSELLKLEAQVDRKRAEIVDRFQEVVNHAGSIAGHHKLEDVTFKTPYGDLHLLFEGTTYPTVIKAPPAFRRFLQEVNK